MYGLAVALLLPSYIVTTVAGNGVAGFQGDGGAAVDSQVNIPMGLALDSSGNLYIADQLNARIRKVTPDGVISTVAGNGTAGYAGDAGAATSAQLNNPCGVAVDKSGTLYIADTRNHRIRKVTAGGTISTVAGTGEAAFEGDGAAATAAKINMPLAVALDAAGTVYFTDTANNVVRKIASDGTISTVAGTSLPGFNGDGGAATSAELNQPTGLTFDSSGNLYIADTFNQRIRKVATDGTISTVAGSGANGFGGDGGQAVNAAFSYPENIAFDAAGNLFVADSINSRIRMIATDGTIGTVAGNGSVGANGDGGLALRAGLEFPRAVVVDGSGNVYFSDNQASRIRVLKPAPVSVTQAPSITSATSASAFGGGRSIAPGTWVEIIGTSLATRTREWTGADFLGGKAPTTLGGTQVTIGGRSAFLSYVSATQVNALVASDAALGPQSIVVTTSDGTSDAYPIVINQAEPGLLAPSAFQSSGRQYVAAFAPDGSTTGLVSRRVKPGDTIALYGIGFGAVTPSVNAGDIPQTATALLQPLQVFFDSTRATVAYAGLVAGTVGLYQISVVVPQIEASDTVRLTFTLNGLVDEQILYIAVGSQ